MNENRPAGLGGPMLNRRQLLAASAAAIALGPTPAGATENGLRQKAARRGLMFGCAVTSQMLQASARGRAAVITEAGMVVPEYEMKWGQNQPNQASADYRAGDIIADFASRNGMALRGHTAIWHRNLPRWAASRMDGPEGLDLIGERVRDIVGHYRGQAVAWDVVNEAIEPNDGLTDDLRASPLLRAGPQYIPLAFYQAHEADPKAALFYNDYGVEYADAESDRRRAGILKLLTSLKRQGAPIHGLGIQSHLGVGKRFNGAVFGRFLADIADLGLEIHLTEMDVNDQNAPRDIAERDSAVADHARAFLDVALDQRAVTALLTWGLSDTGTWLNADRPRRDGQRQRPLPLDSAFVRKPLWQAIADCLDAAPSR